MPKVTPEVSVDFSAAPLAVPSTWTDLSTRCRRLTIRRGRSHELNRTGAGVLEALLDNRDRELDPDNTLGTYYPNVKPMKHVRARATLSGTVYPLFSGYVEDWGQDWPGPSGSTADAVVPLRATDAFKVLNLSRVAGTRYTHELYTDFVDSLVTGANAAHYWLDEASGTVVNDRLGSFDLNADTTNVTVGDSARPPTYGRPRSVSFGTADSAGNGLSRNTGPAFDTASPQQFYWGCWLRLDSLSTDGYVVGLRTTQTFTPTFIWKMNAGGTAIVTYTNATNSVGETLEVTKAGFFEADGEWHHYGIRPTIVEGGPGTGKLMVEFFKDGASAGTVTDLNDFGGSHGVRTLLQFGGSIDALFAGGDGGLGGNHGLDGNMAHLLLIHNNAPQPTQSAQLGTPTFDVIPQEAAGLQIHSILDGVGWPSTALRSIDSGSAEMASISFDTGAEILSTVLQIAETSERGRFFADAAGTLTFEAATTVAAKVSQATFGDSPLEVQYAALQTRHDDADIWNQVVVTHDINGVTAATQYREDSTSISSYGPRLLSVDVNLIATADAAALASTLLATYKDPTTRPVQMELRATEDEAKLAQILARQPGDRITIRRRPPGGGVLQFESIIEGLTIETEPSGLWRATWDLAPHSVEDTWDPLLISGLQLWLAADHVGGFGTTLSDGASVSTWTDLSDQGNDATTAGAAPTYKTGILNGLPVVRFAASSSQYLCANGAATIVSGSDKPFTAVSAFKGTSGADVYSWGNSGNSVPFLTMRLSSDKPSSWKRDDAASGTQKIPSGGTNTGFHLVSHVHTGTAVSLYVNGVATSVNGTIDDVGTTTLDRFTLGAFGRTTVTGFFTGDIAELMIYNRALTDAEREHLERYLMNKWGL